MILFGVRFMHVLTTFEWFTLNYLTIPMYGQNLVAFLVTEQCMHQKMVKGVHIAYLHNSVSDFNNM